MFSFIRVIVRTMYIVCTQQRIAWQDDYSFLTWRITQYLWHISQYYFSDTVYPFVITCTRNLKARVECTLISQILSYNYNTNFRVRIHVCDTTTKVLRIGNSLHTRRVVYAALHSCILVPTESEHIFDSRFRVQVIATAQKKNSRKINN